MLEEDSDNDELDEETISDDRHSLSGISDISSDEEDLYRPSDASSSSDKDEEDLYCPSDASSLSDEDQEPTRNASLQFSRNGETWSPLLSARSVRTNPSNIVHVKPGVNPALRSKAATSPYNCWKLFVDNSMLKTIQEHIIREAKKKNPNFELSLEKLEAFIGLQYLRGICGKRHPFEFLWNKEYGPKMLCNTMARDCFVEIKRFLRFDNKDRRRQRLENDKFVHIRELFEAFTSNCFYNYTPEWSLTINEQLFPMKNRCPFIVFMPNKPEKFGMKFWVLAEVSSKYVCNILPYLGTLEKEQRNGKPLAENVVMRLTAGFHKRGYNVTTVIFFTTVKVAGLLQEKNTTLVGTVRTNVKSIQYQKK